MCECVWSWYGSSEEERWREEKEKSAKQRLVIKVSEDSPFKSSASQLGGQEEVSKPSVLHQWLFLGFCLPRRDKVSFVTQDNSYDETG